MNMRVWLTLAEALSAEFTPADRFIEAATRAIKTTYGDEVFVRFRKTGPRRVQVADDMQGIRTKRSWAILRALTQLANAHDIDMNIQGAAGRRFG